MKQPTTLVLRIAVVLIGIPVLALCIFVAPELASWMAEINPKLAFLQYPFLMVLYATAVAYYIALYQALKLLGYIDRNLAFSDLSVKALKNIKNCALTISILYVPCLPLIYVIADADDAPGLLALALVVTFAALAVALFAAVLQKLLVEAIAIKSENDLTV